MCGQVPKRNPVRKRQRVYYVRDKDTEEYREDGKKKGIGNKKLKKPKEKEPQTTLDKKGRYVFKVSQNEKCRRNESPHHTAEASTTTTAQHT